MKLFLSSSENVGFLTQREIISYERNRLENRNVLIVKVDIPLKRDGRYYGKLGDKIDIFYLINRIDERAFDKLDCFPINVYVCLPKNIDEEIISIKQLENIAWADIYDNFEDADRLGYL